MRRFKRKTTYAIKFTDGTRGIVSSSRGAQMYQGTLYRLDGDWQNIVYDDPEICLQGWHAFALSRKGVRHALEQSFVRGLDDYGIPLRGHTDVWIVEMDVTCVSWKGYKFAARNVRFVKKLGSILHPMDIKSCVTRVWGKVQREMKKINGSHR